MYYEKNWKMINNTVDAKRRGVKVGKQVEEEELTEEQKAAKAAKAAELEAKKAAEKAAKEAAEDAEPMPGSK